MEKETTMPSGRLTRSSVKGKQIQCSEISFASFSEHKPRKGRKVSKQIFPPTIVQEPAVCDEAQPSSELIHEPNLLTPRKCKANADLLQTPRRSTRKSVKPKQDYSDIISTTSEHHSDSVSTNTTEDVEDTQKWIAKEVGRVSQKRKSRKKTLKRSLKPKAIDYSNKLYPIADDQDDNKENVEPREYQKKPKELPPLEQSIGPRRSYELAAAVQQRNEMVARRLNTSDPGANRTNKLYPKLRDSFGKVVRKLVLDKTDASDKAVVKEVQKESNKEMCDILNHTKELNEKTDALDDSDCIIVFTENLISPPKVADVLEIETEKEGEKEHDSNIERSDVVDECEEKGEKKTCHTSNTVDISAECQKKARNTGIDSKKVVFKLHEMRTPADQKRMPLAATPYKNIAINELSPEMGTVDLKIVGFDASAVPPLPVSHGKRQRSLSEGSDAKKTALESNEKTGNDVEIEKTHITFRRKRSLSADSKRINKVVQKDQSRCGVAANVSKLPTRSKLPNFTAIHEREFNKMESLVDHMKRKEDRAKNLLQSGSKLRLVSAQKSKTGVLNKKINVTNIPARKQLMTNQTSKAVNIPSSDEEETENKFRNLPDPRHFKKAVGVPLQTVTNPKTALAKTQSKILKSAPSKKPISSQSKHVFNLSTHIDRPPGLPTFKPIKSYKDENMHKSRPVGILQKTGKVTEDKSLSVNNSKLNLTNISIQQKPKQNEGSRLLKKHADKHLGIFQSSSFKAGEGVNHTFSTNTDHSKLPLPQAKPKEAANGRLQKHKDMYKSRRVGDTKKGADFINNVRLNRRFNLQMEHRKNLMG